MDNEELLRAGECSKRACCIEPMGHAGPCTGDADDLRHQLQQAQEWGKYWWTVSNGLYVAFMSTQAERDAATERGVAAERWAIAVNVRRVAAEFIANDEARIRRHADTCLERVGRRAEAAERDAAEQRALAETHRVEIGHWVKAYGPDLIVYPSKEEIRAVNKTPEFIIGRNATMQVVSEGLQAILDAPAEALRARSPQSGQKEGD